MNFAMVLMLGLFQAFEAHRMQHYQKLPTTVSGESEVVPFVFSKMRCSMACNRKPKCLAFRWRTNEREPCELMLTLNGWSSAKEAVAHGVDTYLATVRDDYRVYFLPFIHDIEKAKKTCRSYGGHLPDVPSDADELNWLTSFMPLQYVNLNYIDGQLTDLEGNTITHAEWAVNYPNPNESQKCVLLSKEGLKNQRCVSKPVRGTLCSVPLR